MTGICHFSTEADLFGVQYTGVAESRIGKEFKVGFSIKPTRPIVEDMRFCLSWPGIIDIKVSHHAGWGVDITSMAIRLKKQGGWQIKELPCMLPLLDDMGVYYPNFA